MAGMKRPQRRPLTRLVRSGAAFLSLVTAIGLWVSPAAAASCWTKIPGSNARAVDTVGLMAPIFEISNDPAPGGYVVKTYSPFNEWWDETWESWDPSVGAYYGIAADPNGGAWIINDQYQIFRSVRRDPSVWEWHWEQVPGAASDISIGGDGSVWVLGATQVSDDGYGIYRWNGSNWTRIDGAGRLIDVDNHGQPYVLTGQWGQERVLRRVGGTWQQVGQGGVGGPNYFGIAASGSPDPLGNSIPGDGIHALHWRATHPNGNIVVRWNGSSWVDTGASGGIDLSVDQFGFAWLVNWQGEIFRGKCA